MRKLNVLIIAPDYFVPENKNGVNKTLYNIMKDNTGLEVSYVYPKESDSKTTLPLGFSNLNLYPAPAALETQSKLLKKICSFFSLKPFISASKKQISSLYETSFPLLNRAELIQISSPSLLPLLDHFSPELKRKTVICAIDCLAFFYESRVLNEDNPLKRILWKIELAKAKHFEKKYYTQVPKVLFVSPEDARYAMTSYNSQTIYKGLRYGVDIKKFDELEKNSEEVNEEAQTLIFTGNFDYGPNISGAMFLIKEVMPLLWQKYPRARLIIAGANPSEEIKKSAQELIIVTGFVDNLTPYIKKSQIFLSPIFFGAGVKTKVLEAMYLEKIVLGSKESFNAIHCEDKIDCLMLENAKDPMKWAHKISEIFAHPDQFIQISKNAKKSILKIHQWEETKYDYNKEYLELIETLN